MFEASRGPIGPLGAMLERLLSISPFLRINLRASASYVSEDNLRNAKI